MKPYVLFRPKRERERKRRFLIKSESSAPFLDSLGTRTSKKKKKTQAQLCLK